MKPILKVRRGIIVFIVLFIILVTPSYASEVIGKREKKFPKNVYLNGIELEGKTLKEVEAQIDEEIGRLESKYININFTYKGEVQNRKFKLKDLGYYSSKEEVKKEIYLILYNDLNPVDKVKSYIDVRKNGRSYEITHGIGYEKFCKALDVFDTSKLPKPVNAKYEYKNGEVIIIQEVHGYELDKEKLYKEILENITEKQDEYTLYFKIRNPKVTKEVLKKQGIKEKFTSFTTRFNSNNVPRSKNIRLAASIIDGTIIAPGEVFSFNKVVGKRTRKRGFEEAGIYINGNLDSGLGGGICQVSSTLYNAVLLADLEVIQRNNHSLTVHYVPLSRDAAVSWGTKDLKFRNNKDFYIYIHANSVGNTVTFDLFGTRINTRVELVSKTLSSKESPVEYIKDVEMEEGKTEIIQKGHIGYESKLIKKVYKSGKLVKSETVSHDKYLSSPTIIRKGTQVES